MYTKLVSLIFLFVILCLPHSGWAGVDGWISGTVTDSHGIVLSKQKIRLISLDGEVIKETISSDTGEFQFFPLTFGDYRISIESIDFDPYKMDVHVASGGGSALEISLNSKNSDSAKEMVIEVKAKKRLVQSSSAVSSVEVSRDQIKQLPQGVEVSLPKLLATTTPGVVQGAFGQTFIRGNHANVQYQIDGVQIPDSPSNTFGQSVSPRNIDHMEIITGGIPAEYGQRLSAVVNIVTKSGAEKPEGEAEMNYGSYNTMSPHLIYGGSTETGNVHYFFSAHYNRTDRGLDTPQPESYDNQNQGGRESVHNTAIGNSQFAKIDWLADNSNKVSWILSHSQSKFQIPTFPSNFSYKDDFFQPGYSDQFGNSKGSSEPTFNYVPTDTNNAQSETNAYTQVVWKQTFSEKSFLQIAPYYRYSSIAVDNDLNNDLFSLSVPITGASPSSFSQNRHVNNLGLKGDYSFRPNDSHLIKAGFQVQASRSDGNITIQTNPNQPAMVDSTPNTGYFEGIYVQDDITLAKPLVLNAGLRYDATQFQFGNLSPTDSMLQPRVGLNYMATDTTKLHLFYGKLFQPAPVENLRYKMNPVTGTFSSLDSYDIKAEKNDYYEAGIAQQIFDSQVVQLNAYYKDGTNILDDFQVLNTSIAQPYNFAEGFGYGVELSVKGQLTKDWSEFANYTYTIAKGNGINGGDEESGPGYQMLDHVQVHTSNMGLTYSKNSFWWTTQALYGSGLRTGVFNSRSLPAHLTFDTTVGYQFRGRQWWSQVRLSGDILNILDNRYPITIANGFNGSHYAAGRQAVLRVSKEF